jgi:hypothetical protein
VFIFLLLEFVCTDIAPTVGSGSDYENWKAKYGFKYDIDDDRYRLFLYRQKQLQIRAHNQNPRNGWKMGENQFSALTEEEFARTSLGLIPPPKLRLHVVSHVNSGGSGDNQDSSES